jgi:hypothetical protein
MRINIKHGENKKKNKNVDKISFCYFQLLLNIVLVRARYGSDVEDDSNEESEDENAEVYLCYEIFYYRYFLGMDK